MPVFKIGDIVRLKSGGPNMTIEGEAHGEYVCIWFDQRTRKTDVFSGATLEKVKRRTMGVGNIPRPK